MDANTTKQIAEEIARQLGGRRFIAMTGTSLYSGVNKEGNVELTIKLPKYHAVRVTLNPSDTYSVEYFRMKRDYTIETLKTASDVYCDQLQEIFTSMTGLYTSLGTMGQ